MTIAVTTGVTVARAPVSFAALVVMVVMVMTTAVVMMTTTTTTGRARRRWFVQGINHSAVDHERREIQFFREANDRVDFAGVHVALLEALEMKA